MVFFVQILCTIYHLHDGITGVQRYFGTISDLSSGMSKPSSHLFA